MYLSASQLFDLVKAKKRATQTGKRGGRFYVSSSGKRVYTGEDPAVEAKHVAQTPHTSSRTQGPVDVTLLPAGPEDPAMQGKMKIRPEKHFINMATRRAAIQQQQQNWPSYFCRSCKAAIVPKHDVPIREGSPHHQVPEPSKVDAKGEPIRRRVGTTTKVLVVRPSGRRSTHYGWNPEYLSSRQCPDCFDAEAKAARKESKEASETKRDVDLFLTHTQQMASQKKQSEKETRRLARLAKEGEKRRARVEQSSQRVRDEREKQKAKAKRAHVIREDKPAVPSISFRDRVRGRFTTEYGTARTGVVVNTQLREGQMYYQIEPDVKTPEDKPKPRVWAPRGSLKKIEKSVTLWVSL
jgi:hypothetical protein